MRAAGRRAARTCTGTRACSSGSPRPRTQPRSASPASPARRWSAGGPPGCAGGGRSPASTGEETVAATAPVEEAASRSARRAARLRRRACSSDEPCRSRRTTRPAAREGCRSRRRGCRGWAAAGTCLECRAAAAERWPDERPATRRRPADRPPRKSTRARRRPSPTTSCRPAGDLGGAAAGAAARARPRWRAVPSTPSPQPVAPRSPPPSAAYPSPALGSRRRWKEETNESGAGRR